MNLMRLFRITTGVLVWCGIVVASVWFLGQAGGRGREVAGAALSYLSTRPVEYTLELPHALRIDVGTIVVDEDPEAPGQDLGAVPASHPLGKRFAGEVSALLDANGKPMGSLYGTAKAVRVRLFDGSRPLRTEGQVRVVIVPQTFRWVVQTLLTDEATVRLAEEWNRTMFRHRDEFFALLTPVAREVIAGLETLMTAELPRFVKRHRAEVEKLAGTVEKDLMGEDLAKLFQEEIWPTAEAKLRPVLERIGADIWKKAPLWRLSWRFAYERLPLTDDDHFRPAWDEFVDEQVVPTLKEHSGEVLASIRSVTTQTLKNPRIARQLRSTLRATLSDPGFQHLAQEFLKETVLDNPRFHELVRKQWNSPSVKLAVNKAGSYLEPMIRRMGDHVLGSRSQGLTKEFARVLRAQILLKDHHRIVISRGDTTAAPLPSGSTLRATLEWETSR